MQVEEKESRPMLDDHPLKGRRMHLHTFSITVWFAFASVVANAGELLLVDGTHVLVAIEKLYGH